MTKAGDFAQLIYQLLPSVRKYVNHRLTLAEKKGLIEAGLYQTDDVVDEALLKVYQSYVDHGFVDSKAVKIALFQAVNQVLNQLIAKEAPLADAVSTEELYEAELSELFEIERLTVDGDGELVFAEEIDEKEYPVKEPTVWILEKDLLDELIEKLELDKSLLQTDSQKKQAAARYVTLKTQTRIFIDLVAFGGLELDEAAEVVGITPGQAKIVLGKVKEALVKS